MEKHCLMNTMLKKNIDYFTSFDIVLNINDTKSL